METSNIVVDKQILEFQDFRSESLLHQWQLLLSKIEISDSLYGYHDSLSGDRYCDMIKRRPLEFSENGDTWRFDSAFHRHDDCSFSRMETIQTGFISLVIFNKYCSDRNDNVTKIWGTFLYLASLFMIFWKRACTSEYVILCRIQIPPVASKGIN